MPPDIDHEWTSNPVCPWCGKEDTPWWESATTDQYDKGEWERLCPQCGRRYAVRLDIIHRFTTEKAGSSDA